MLQKIKQIITVLIDWVKINPVYTAIFVMMILMIIMLIFIVVKIRSSKVRLKKGKGK